MLISSIKNCRTLESLSQGKNNFIKWLCQVRKVCKTLIIITFIIIITADGTMVEFCQYVGDGTSAQVEVFPGSEFVTEDCKTCKCTPAGLACCQ